MKKSEFERRAAEMKAKNLAHRARSVRMVLPMTAMAAAKPETPLAKIYVRDFLTEADFQQLNPHLQAISKLGLVEADSDGLLDFRRAGLNIVVSPDLFMRGIEVYDALLKEAAEQGWVVKQPEKSYLQIVVDGQALDFSVCEKTEAIPQLRSFTGLIVPRRPRCGDSR